jgi:hypothetical protein
LVYNQMKNTNGMMNILYVNDQNEALHKTKKIIFHIKHTLGIFILRKPVFDYTRTVLLPCCALMPSNFQAGSKKPSIPMRKSRDTRVYIDGFGGAWW